MIIFDLDGTLADCEHRRHFIETPWDECGLCYDFLTDKFPVKDFSQKCLCGRYPGLWELDWKAFYEACEFDEPIEPVWKLFDDLAVDNELEIWSGRCESVREKTVNWLYEYVPYTSQKLKMRPIGDTTPDDVLKERWLDEYLNLPSMDTASGNINKIEIVFDSDPKSIAMYRRRGIFVFDVNQSGKEF